MAAASSAAASAAPRSTLVVAALVCASAAAAATLAYIAYRTATSPKGGSHSHRRSRKKSGQRGKRHDHAADASPSSAALSMKPQSPISLKYSSTSPEFMENMRRLVKEGNDAEFCATLSEEARANLAEKIKEHGNVYFKETKYEDASKLYTLAISLCPEIPVLHLNRAASYVAMRLFDEAIVDSSFVIEKDPTCEKAYYRRAYSYYGLKNYMSALFDFMTLSILQSFKDEHNVAMIETVLREAAIVEIEKMNPTFKPGFHSIVSCRHALSCLVNLNPVWLEGPEAQVENSAEWHFFRAVKLIVESKFEEAFVDLELAQSLIPDGAPSSPEASHRYGDIMNLYAALCSLSKREVEANDALRKADAYFDSQNVVGLLLRSTLALEASDHDRAIGFVQEALQLAPDNPSVLYQRGQLAFFYNDVQSSISFFERAATLRPDFVFAHVQNAVALYKTGKKRACLEKFKTSLARFPQSADLYNFYGEILFDMEDFDGAVAAFERALKLDPKLSLSRVNLAALAQVKRDFKTCEEHLNAALEIDPGLDFALLQLSSLLIQMQREDEGVAIMEKMVGISRSKEELVAYTMSKIRTLGDIEITKRLSRKTIDRCITIATGNMQKF